MPNSTVDTRSEEVQEIVGQVPSWIIRWGITAVFIFLVLILWISWFIRYPDVIKGEAIITTKVSPVELVAKQNGELVLLVSDEEFVHQNQAIGYINSSANFDEVIKLENYLHKGASHELEIFESLGEIQSYYNDYLLFNEWKHQLKFEPQLQEISHIKEQINNLNSLNQNLIAESSILKNEIKLLQENYRVDSTLHVQHVIASVEFKERTMVFLEKQRTLKNQEAKIINNAYQIEGLEKQVSALNADFNSVDASLENKLKSSKSALKNAISRWKNEVVFTAPIDGKVTYMSFLENNQYVQSGKSLFTILPHDQSFYAQVNLPIQSSGKVAIGQQVNIKLDNYPDHEFGMLVGSVEKISDIPSIGADEDKVFYRLLVDLPSGLITSHNKKLPNKHYLSGQMEVITQKRRVIQRVFSWAKHI